MSDGAGSDNGASPSAASGPKPFAANAPGPIHQPRRRRNPTISGSLEARLTGYSSRSTQTIFSCRAKRRRHNRGPSRVNLSRSGSHGSNLPSYGAGGICATGVDMNREKTILFITALGAGVFLVFGLWPFFDAESFFDDAAEFNPYNAH